MRILRVHNYYQQAGGEDAVVASEAELLASRGHTVIPHFVHNDAIDGMSRVTVAGKTIWNRDSAADLRRILAEHRPDVVHFDNTFPLVSPSAYYAARDAGVPVIQTLHNYRLLCVNATLFRDGRVCEECVGRAIPWPGVQHACYRNDRKASAVVAAMLSFHRAIGTYRHAITTYIALTEFARRKYIQGGLPASRIVVKPNFLETDPGVGPGNGRFALFVGRLTEEKGVRVLVDAWRHIGDRLPLKVVGSGPLEGELAAAASGVAGVQLLGRQPLDRVMQMMGEAAVLVFPSTWYEGLPRTIVESFAKGTPVIASDLGSMAELVDHGRTGLKFRPGDPADLARQIERLISDPGLLPALRSAARDEYERKFTADQAYDALMHIYRSAIKQNRHR